MNRNAKPRARLKRWLMLLVAWALGLGLIYWLRPGWMLDAYFAVQRWHAGVKEGSVSVAGANWRYVDGGSGEPVLLVHGMAGSKENWFLLAPHLTDAYRVVAPDQAGFGGSEEAVDNDYRISAQVERLREFADAMKLQRFHLVGHSMGGHTAGVFAARYPERVQTLTLMNSAGVPFKPNAFQAMIERGENPFATETIEKFDAFMRMTFEHPPFAPPRMRQVYADRNASRAGLWNGILQRIVSPKTRFFLQGKLADIKSPTLVLWCDRDQLLDVSSVDAFRAGLPQARIEILQGCGHMPMMEKPVETATLLRQRFAMQEQM